MQYTAMGNTTAFIDEALHVPLPDSSYALVVDDDQSILSVVMLLLETEGYSGFGFSDSQKVLPFLKYVPEEHLPSVILLDLMMPGISGYEIVEHMKRDTKLSQIPIIIMTADSRVRGASAVPGATDWVSKPFQVASLLRKLGTYLEE